MITIIIPAYNSEKTIEKCIKSVIMQTYKNIEIIVVDDGSNDKTSIVVKKLQIGDKRIKLLQKKNGGVSSARNLGIKKAKGKFITFIDSDDEILPNMLEKMKEAQEFYDADLIKVAISRVLNEKKQYTLEDKEKKIYCSKLEWRENFFFILKNGLNSPVGKLYKKSILDKHGIFFNEKLDISEDLHFNLKYLEKINKLVLLPESYYKYYLFNSVLTTKYRENLFNNRKISIELFADFLRRNEISENITYYLYIKLLFSEAIGEIYHKTNKKERIYKICKNLETLEIKESLDKYIPEGIISRFLYQICKIKNGKIIDLICRFIILFKENRYLRSIRKISV